MLIVSTGQGQFDSEVTKSHDVLSSHEYCVKHVSRVTSGVETNGNGYFVIWPQLQVTMRWNNVKRVKFWKSSFFFEKKWK